MEKTTVKQSDGSYGVMGAFSDGLSSDKEKSNANHQIADFAMAAKKQISTKGREAFKVIDRNARTQPWTYIAGAAVAGLVVSYFMKRGNSKS